MKRFFFFFLFCTLCSFSFAQNLIPNPSAEDFIECPEQLGGFADEGNGVDSFVPPWQSFRGTPDYFNSCSETPLLGWNNIIGNQQPRTGNGYLGLATFHQGLENARESFGVEMDIPLVIGEIYYLSFYVSAAYQPIAFNMTTNNIGFLLMVENYLVPEEQGNLPNLSNFYSDEIISDTTNWVNLHTSFVADSNYRFISFGNFFEDQYTDTLRLEGDLSNAISYYFFDDFCLSLSPEECDISVSISNTLSKNNISVYPNPTQGSLTVTTDLKILDLEILNMNGQIQYSDHQLNIDDLKVEFILNPGLYILKIQTEEGISTKRFVVQ